MKSIKPIIIATLLALPGIAMAQLPGLTGQTKNYISTGMPILLIAPDAISAGMGDAGAASTPDIYSAHWNNAKYAFIDGDIGVGTNASTAVAPSVPHSPISPLAKSRVPMPTVIPAAL